MHSSSVLMSTGGFTEVYPGAVVTVQCREGYSLQEPYSGQAQVSLRCQEGGAYDKTSPVCARKPIYLTLCKYLFFNNDICFLLFYSYIIYRAF